MHRQSYVKAGRATALRNLGLSSKLAFDYNDAMSVARAAKKYALPKAALRVSPTRVTAPSMHGSVYEFNSPMAVPSKASTAGYLSQFMKTHDARARGPALQRDVKQHVQQSMQPVEGLERYSRHGAILPGSPGIWNTLARGAPPAPPLTPRHKAFNNAMAAAHERDELLSPAGSGFLDFGHRSPEVMLREHNRVVTAPREFEPIRDFHKTIRIGEGNIFKQHGLTFGEGERLNRRQRRFYTEQMNKAKDEQIRQQLDMMYPIQTP